MSRDNISRVFCSEVTEVLYVEDVAHSPIRLCVEGSNDIYRMGMYIF